MEEALDYGNAVNDSMLSNLNFVLVSLITLSLFLIVDLLYEVLSQSNVFSWASLQSYVGREWFFRGLTCVSCLKSAAIIMVAVNLKSHRIRDASLLSVAFMTGNMSIFGGSMLIITDYIQFIFSSKPKYQMAWRTGLCCFLTAIYCLTQVGYFLMDYSPYTNHILATILVVIYAVCSLSMICYMVANSLKFIYRRYLKPFGGDSAKPLSPKETRLLCYTAAYTVYIVVIVAFVDHRARLTYNSSVANILGDVVAQLLFLVMAAWLPALVTRCELKQLEMSIRVCTKVGTHLIALDQQLEDLLLSSVEDSETGSDDTGNQSREGGGDENGSVSSARSASVGVSVGVQLDAPVRVRNEKLLVDLSRAADTCALAMTAVEDFVSVVVHSGLTLRNISHTKNGDRNDGGSEASIDVVRLSSTVGCPGGPESARAELGVGMSRDDDDYQSLQATTGGDNDAVGRHPVSATGSRWSRRRRDRSRSWQGSKDSFWRQGSASGQMGDEGMEDRLPAPVSISAPKQTKGRRDADYGLRLKLDFQRLQTRVDTRLGLGLDLGLDLSTIALGSGAKVGEASCIAMCGSGPRSSRGVGVGVDCYDDDHGVQSSVSLTPRRTQKHKRRHGRKQGQMPGETPGQLQARVPEVEQQSRQVGSPLMSSVQVLSDSVLPDAVAEGRQGGLPEHEGTDAMAVMAGDDEELVSIDSSKGVVGCGGALAATAGGEMYEDEDGASGQRAWRALASNRPTIKRIQLIQTEGRDERTVPQGPPQSQQSRPQSQPQPQSHWDDAPSEELHYRSILRSSRASSFSGSNFHVGLGRVVRFPDPLTPRGDSYCGNSQAEYLGSEDTGSWNGSQHHGMCQETQSVDSSGSTGRSDTGSGSGSGEQSNSSSCNFSYNYLYEGKRAGGPEASPALATGASVTVTERPFTPSRTTAFKMMLPIVRRGSGSGSGSGRGTGNASGSGTDTRPLTAAVEGTMWSAAYANVNLNVDATANANANATETAHGKASRADGCCDGRPPRRHSIQSADQALLVGRAMARRAAASATADTNQCRYKVPAVVFWPHPRSRASRHGAEGTEEASGEGEAKAAVMVLTLSRAVMHGFKSLASVTGVALQPLLQLTPAASQHVTFLQRQLQGFHLDLWLTMTTFELFARSFDLTALASATSSSAGCRAAVSRHQTLQQSSRASSLHASTSHHDNAATTANASASDLPHQMLVDLNAYLRAVRVLLDKSGSSLATAAENVAMTKELQSWNQLFS